MSFITAFPWLIYIVYLSEVPITVWSSVFNTFMYFVLFLSCPLFSPLLNPQQELNVKRDEWAGVVMHTFTPALNWRPVWAVWWDLGRKAEAFPAWDASNKALKWLGNIDTIRFCFCFYKQSKLYDLHFYSRAWVI